MNNRELFKNAFDDIAPSQELIQKVKDFKPTAHKRGIRLRKGVIIPAVIILQPASVSPPQQLREILTLSEFSGTGYMWQTASLPRSLQEV